MKKRTHQIELFIKYPYEVQEEIRKKLIHQARNTVWGKKYEYKSIDTRSDYIERVPIQNYNSLKKYIGAHKKGEKSVLWPGEIKWFAKSSGTTSDKSKFIPVSKEALEDCHFKGGKDMLSIYCNNNPDTQIFTGKGLMMGGSQQINQINNASFYGDLSAILMSNFPFWAEIRQTPANKIALIEEWEEKLEKMATATIQENVTSISGVPSWTLVLLQKIIEQTNANNILEVWPQLELYIHGAVSFKPYREQFKKLIPSSGMNYLETYNASEGFFGIQDQPNSEDMLLMLDYGIYYEFIPESEFGKKHPRAIPLEEVEKDQLYSVIITTNAGLWRYNLEDTIVFTDLSPHRIRIVGRTKFFINAFGEEVIVENAENALAIACQKTNSTIADYTAGPVYMGEGGSGAHEWIIEFADSPDDLEYFVEILDNALKSINSDYEAKRHKNYVLQAPIVHEAPKGTFYNWMKKRGKLGGQNKVPRLVNNRKYLDELLEVIK